MAQCKGKSKQSGKQCLQPAIPGGAVCRYHGGAAPQVIRRAQERLDALVDPAIGQLRRLLNSKNDAVVLGAVKDILDRCGYKAIDRQEVVNYSAEDVEQLSNLTDEELAQYIELRKKMGIAPTTGASREQVH
jgi:phosphopentomutase